MNSTKWQGKKSCWACHGPVHYNIKFTYSKDAHNILGLILLYISCKPYRDNKLKKLLTAVSDFTQQRQVTTVSHGSVSLSDLFYNSISISDCTALSERRVGDWTDKHLERRIHDLVEELSCYFPRGSEKNHKKKLTEYLVINKHLSHTSVMCYNYTNLLGCHTKKHVHHTLVIGIFMNTLICLYCCTVHLVDSLNITLPTTALIVCHLF